MKEDTNKNFHFSHNKNTKQHTSQFISHRHNHYEILLVINGKGRFVIEDKIYNFNKNSLFLISPALFHSIVEVQNDTYERYVIHFSSSFIPLCITPPTAMQTTVPSELIDIFCRFDSAQKKYPPEWSPSLFHSFITETLLFIEFRKNCNNLSSYPLPPLVNATITYIDKNIYSPLNSHKIASALFVDRAHLSRVFSNVMKTPLMQYVKSKKMHIAYELLKKGNTPQKTSEMLGFDNYSTFYRDFVREFAILPSRITDKTLLYP